MLKVIIIKLNIFQLYRFINPEETSAYQVHQRLSGSCLSQTYFSQSPTLPRPTQYALFLTVSVKYLKDTSKRLPKQISQSVGSVDRAKRIQD